METHHENLPSEGIYINLNGYTLSLVILERLIDSFCSLEVNIDGGQIFLEVVNALERL